jgi:hypothetical protein
LQQPAVLPDGLGQAGVLRGSIQARTKPDAGQQRFGVQIDQLQAVIEQATLPDRTRKPSAVPHRTPAGLVAQPPALGGENHPIDALHEAAVRE